MHTKIQNLRIAQNEMPSKNIIDNDNEINRQTEFMKQIADFLIVKEKETETEIGIWFKLNILLYCFLVLGLYLIHLFSFTVEGNYFPTILS